MRQFLLMERRSDWSNKWLSVETFLGKQEFSTQTATEEFEPVALDNFDFENRQNTNINSFNSHFENVLNKIPIWEMILEKMQSNSQVIV